MRAAPVPLAPLMAVLVTTIDLSLEKARYVLL